LEIRQWLVLDKQEKRIAGADTCVKSVFRVRILWQANLIIHCYYREALQNQFQTHWDSHQDVLKDKPPFSVEELRECCNVYILKGHKMQAGDPQAPVAWLSPNPKASKPVKMGEGIKDDDRRGEFN
jgi:hypothetical protein